MIYIVDTDALVHIHTRPHADRVYAGLIEHVKAGQLRTVEQVFDEMRRWPEIRKMFWELRSFMKVDQYHADVQAVVGSISDNHEYLYDLTGSKNPDSADPWLIGCAKVFKYTLVTDERTTSTKKIPHVCRQQGINVPCINGLSMIEELGCG